MKMPSKIKKAWLKALRSGEYGQTKETLTNGKGGFCCLGVLQHVVSGGACETDDDGIFADEPSLKWYRENNIVIDTEKSWFDNSEFKSDLDERILIRMNDEDRNKFSTIANWIEKNIETTDNRLWDRYKLANK